MSPRDSKNAWPFACIVLALWTARVMCEPWLAEAASVPVLHRALYDGARIALFVLLPLALVVRIERRPIASPFGMAPGRWPRLAWVLVAAWLSGLVGIEWLARGILPIRAAAVDLPPLVLGAVITAACEEFAFRGVLLPRFIARHGPILGQVATALVFVLVHWPGWLLLQGIGPAELAGQSFRLVLLALMLGLVTGLSGSLLPAIVLHADNNILVALFVAPMTR